MDLKIDLSVVGCLLQWLPAWPLPSPSIPADRSLPSQLASVYLAYLKEKTSLCLCPKRLSSTVWTLVISEVYLSRDFYSPVSQMLRVSTFAVAELSGKIVFLPFLRNSLLNWTMLASTIERIFNECASPACCDAYLRLAQ